MKMNTMDWIGLILLVIGGLNWGLIGFFKYDLVSTIFGDMSTASRVVFALVGLAAIWTLAKAMMGGSKAKMPMAPSSSM